MGEFEFTALQPLVPPREPQNTLEEEFLKQRACSKGMKSESLFLLLP